jgi:ABC-type dipeptide/oligopeptide/nickel transport system permease subunit
MTAIKLTWKGKEYRIPADKAFAVGEQVEDVVSLAEIGSWGVKPRFFKIARAFAVMLRFAGCKVSDGEVHEEITGSLLRASKTGAEGAEVSGRAADPIPSFHFLGADKYGRDLFSRLIYGSRISLSIGLVSVAITFVLGLIIGGILVGQIGGRRGTKTPE